MNIDDFTIGEAKKLAALFSNNDAAPNSLNAMIGDKVIIRTYSAGVWFGEIRKKSADEVIAINARRINYFKTIDGISLSSVANRGLHADSRLAEPVDSVWLKAIELIPCTAVAIKSIEGHQSE